VTEGGGAVLVQSGEVVEVEPLTSPGADLGESDGARMLSAEEERRRLYALQHKASLRGGKRFRHSRKR
jgi:hypothetical protein